MLPVSYVYNEKITDFVFSEEHPMKPIRLRMTDSLIQDFGLTSSMKIIEGKRATKHEICQFHNPQYINYLQNYVSPNIESLRSSFDPTDFQNFLQKFEIYNNKFKVNKTFDCPGFQGLYNFCELAAGASLDAVDSIITGKSHFAINWGGGFHHARKKQASGFCYVNDIVISILELLKFYPRVLYVDIDVHHGDGVEEAFYHTNRVLTVSFHEYGDEFFPGTGQLSSVGQGIGKYYSVNVPLNRGVTSISYINIFKRVIDQIINFYHPDVIVMQSGADSLSKDQIGHLELTIGAYGQCLQYLKRYNTPLILLGGGGYTIQNVARCWAYQTSVLLNQNIGNNIPENNVFFDSYEKENYKLHFKAREGIMNNNYMKDFDFYVETIRQNLRKAQGRPSVPYHQIPSNNESRMDEEESQNASESESYERSKPLH